MFRDEYPYCISNVYFNFRKMPLSNAERQRRFREKQRKTHGIGYILKKDANRKKLARNANIFKAREDERKRCREKKKQNFSPSTATSSSPAYKSASSLGKAIKRASEALPGSPRKRSAIVKRLAMRNALTDQRTESNDPHNKIGADVEKAVVDFYQQSDISWMAPGRKDYTIVRKVTGKERLQRSYLMMTVRDAYALFCEQFPDKKIGFSKLASLRPPNVCPNSKFPHNVCMCRYHENMRLLLEALKFQIPSLSS